MKATVKTIFITTLFFVSTFFLLQSASALNRYSNQSGNAMLAENILGMNVIGTNGNTVGNIQDVLFNQHNKIQTFIIATGGGILGFGGKTVAVPGQDMNLHQDQAVYQGTESQLDSLPDINYEAYGRGYTGGYYGYGPMYGYGPGYGYGSGPLYGYGPGSAEHRYGGPDSSRGYYGGRWTQPSGPGISMKVILGADVITNQGDNVADIENLVISPQGRIEAAVIDVGGFLGIGSKKVAIPFNKLKRISAYYVLYPGTEQQLQNLPAFNPNRFEQG